MLICMRAGIRADGAARNVVPLTFVLLDAAKMRGLLTLRIAGGTAAFMRLDGEPWMQDLTGTTAEKPLRVSSCDRQFYGICMENSLGPPCWRAMGDGWLSIRSRCERVGGHKELAGV